MDEMDEDVVYKNTGLYSRLIQEGFSDIETIPSPDNEEHEIDSRCEHSHNTFILDLQNFPDCKLHVDDILNSTLMFEDDVIIVENFLPAELNYQDFKPETFSVMTDHQLRTQNTLIKLMPNNVSKMRITLMKTHFYKIFAVLAICSGVTFYRFNSPVMLSLGFSALLPVVTYVTSKTIYTTYKRKTRENSMKNLLNVLKQFSILLHKSTQYVQECEFIINDNFILRKKVRMISKLADSASADKFNDASSIKWQMMFGLRSSIVNSVTVTISALQATVLMLLKRFPLARNLDDIDHYICRLNQTDMGIRHYHPDEISIQILQKFKCLYLLIQSEFLRRLCLSFNAALWIQDPTIPINSLFDCVLNVTQVCEKQFQFLNREFEAYYTFENLPPSNCVQSSSNRAAGNANKLDTAYKNVYFKTHTVANHLQILTVKTREFEKYLETFLDNERNDAIIDDVNVRLTEILQLHERCKRFLDDLKISAINGTCKKSVNSSNDADSSLDNQQECLDNSNRKSSDNSSNANTVNRDEIFIAMSCPDVTVHSSDYELDSFVESNKYSTTLMNELKVALKDKKLEWKQREKAARRQKHSEYVSSESESNSISDLSDEERDTMKKDRLRNVSASETGDNECEDRYNELTKSQSIPHSFATDDTSSFTQQIAGISSKWGLNVEEICYSDGEDG